MAGDLRQQDRGDQTLRRKFGWLQTEEPAMLLGLVRLLADDASRAHTTDRREAISPEIELLVEDAEPDTAQIHDLSGMRTEPERSRAAIRSAGLHPRQADAAVRP